MTEHAKRYNQGKMDFTVLPVDGLEEVTKVLQKARDEKYPDNPDGTANWEKLWGDKTVKLVLGCAFRHIFAILRGEVYDKESGFQHAGHVIANMFMLIRYFNEQNILPEEQKEISSYIDVRETIGKGG